jgi:hypothetical protein
MVGSGDGERSLADHVSTILWNDVFKIEEQIKEMNADVWMGN